MGGESRGPCSDEGDRDGERMSAATSLSGALTLELALVERQ
jgi:hypothetical protein